MVLIKRPLIVAHRGSSGKYPENTLIAVRKAIEERADIVEIDLQLSRDKRVVVFHDRTLDRIVGKSNCIEDHSLAELKKLDVGSWKDSQYSGTQIPTFNELLEITRGHSLVVEIKPLRNINNVNSRELERKVLDILDNSDGIGHGYISVRDISTLEWFLNHNSRYRVGFMQKHRSSEELFGLINSHQLKIIQIRTASFDLKAYKKLHEFDVKSYAYSADTPHDWNYLSKQPITGILTNYPKQMYTYFNRRLESVTQGFLSK